MNPNDLLQSATKAAEEATKIQLDFLDRNYTINFKDNDPRNLVTEADKASENAIIAHIKKHHPDHEILGEESGDSHSPDQKSTDVYRWIIDPIDGTNNFAHKHPFFAVSIGIEHNGEVIAGIVHAPLLKEVFTTSKGNGAFLNSQQIKVSNSPTIEKSLVATGFPPTHREHNLPYFTNVLHECQGVRRCGAASLDMAYIACGRLDAFWEFGLWPWDIAAASLLITEAGGQCTNITEKHLDLQARNILATNGKVHQEMQKLLNLS